MGDDLDRITGTSLDKGVEMDALKAMAALSGKLRLCKSATTRPESAGLKKALHSGVKPWETDPAMSEYFND